MKSRLIALWLCVALPAFAHATTPGADLAHDIANRYGLAAWPQVQRLEYTFNVARAQGPLERAWAWNVAENTVTRRAPGDAVTLDLAQDPAGWTQAQRQVHRQFINDAYWLLFPFQLVWSNPVVTDAGRAPLPVGDGAMSQKIVAQWPAEGGYTPGDTYELFLDDAGVIRAWTFHRQKNRHNNPAGRSTGFGGHQQVGPLLLPLDQRGAKGLHLWFSEVTLTLRSGEQITAARQP